MKKIFRTMLLASFLFGSVAMISSCGGDKKKADSEQTDDNNDSGNNEENYGGGEKASYNGGKKQVTEADVRAKEKEFRNRAQYVTSQAEAEALIEEAMEYSNTLPADLKELFMELANR